MACASSPSGVLRMKSASSVCIARYTFRVKLLAWLLIIACFASLWWGVTRWRKGLKERDAASEARFAALLAQANPGAASASPVAAAPAAASPPRASPPALPPGAVAREERLLDQAANTSREHERTACRVRLSQR